MKTVLRRLARAFALLAIPAVLAAQAFPHARHARVFPSCTVCHEGIVSGDASRAFPSPTACTACHDGVVQPRITYTPTARHAPDLLNFSHPAHAAKASTVACLQCHAVNDPSAWMTAGRPVPDRCVACHTPRASAHMAADNVCAKCHRPLTAATGLTEEHVAALPKPPSHAPADFVSAHGALARANAPNCSTCHARESCIRCHVNGTSLPQIRALAPDPRIAHLAAAKAPSYPMPADHKDDRWAQLHPAAARADVARCATCHTRSSCETCHLGTGGRDVLRDLPSGKNVTAPGVRLVRDPRTDTASHRVTVHPVGWARTHKGTVATGETSCANCHAQSFCAQCHAGERLMRGFHPANWVSIHAPQAYAREASCNSCHSVEVFCRDCHRQLGMATTKNTARSTVFHNAQPLWLLQHGRAARQDLQTCTTCHQQTYCMQCHSGNGSRINPHGPGFNPAAMSARNQQICLACHFTNPLKK